MSLIKESKGIDFIIQCQPVTDLERNAINEFIRSRKAGSKIQVKGKPKR